MPFKFLKSIAKSHLNFYSSYIPNYQLKDKFLVNKGSFIIFNENELLLLEKTKEIFGSTLDFTSGYKQKETFLAPLHNVSYLGNTGAIVKDQRLVAESLFDLGRLNNSKSFRKIHFLQTKKKNTGIYTSIMLPRFANKNIYHWIADCLPRLYSIKQIPVDEKINLIVNEDIPGYQREMLSFFVNADPRLHIVNIRSNEKWNIQSYWLPSFVTSNTSGYMPKEYLDYIKKTIIGGYNITPGKRFRKVYISRKFSQRRKLVNENEIERSLVEEGFQIIYAEKLEYREQVKLFSECEIIISPHGAGLTNILYATNAKIVELHPEDYAPSHYCLLSKACTHEYFPFFGSIMNDDKSWEINIPAFKSFVQILLKKHEL